MSLPPVIKSEYTDYRTDQIQAPAGGLQIKSLKTRSEDSAYSDHSFVVLQDAFGALLRLFNGNVIISSTADFTLTSMGNFTLSVKGGKQEVISGNSHIYIEGDSSEMIGSQRDEDKAAIESIYEAIKKVQSSRIGIISSAEGKRVPCPICNSEIIKEVKDPRLKKAKDFSKTKINPWNDGPYETLRKLTSYMIAPSLERISTYKARGEVSCGNPGCVDGYIENLAKDLKEDVETSGSEGGTSIEELLCGGDVSPPSSDNNTGGAAFQAGDYVSKTEKSLGIGGHKTFISKGDMLFKAGLKKNDLDGYQNRGRHNFSFYLEPGKGEHRQYLIPGGRGNCPKAHRINAPVMIGNLTLEAANKITINAGTPGIDINSSGHINLEGGSANLIANRGEMTVASNNLTILKGKNILIEAEDDTGDSGLFVKSRTTMIAGAFNVKGDSAFKGHITTDGGVSTPYIVAPSMRLETEMSGSSRVCTGAPVWEEDEKIIEENSFLKDLYRKYNAPWSLMTNDSLINFTLEAYEYLMNDIKEEVFITGWAYTGGIWSKFERINPETNEKEITYSESLPSWCPVYNYKHKHVQYGESHTHSYTAIKGSYYQDNESWGSERGTGNNAIPTQAPIFGDGPSPGGKSKKADPSDNNYFSGKTDGVFGSSNFVKGSEDDMRNIKSSFLER